MKSRYASWSSVSRSLGDAEPPRRSVRSPMEGETRAAFPASFFSRSTALNFPRPLSSVICPANADDM